MATRDFTASPLRELIVRYTRKQGAIEEHTMVFDAAKVLFLNADVNELMDVKKGDTVLNTSIKVVKAGTATVTLDLGDGGLATRYHAAVAADAAAGTIVGAALAAPFTYTADDTIDLDTDVAELLVGTFQITVLLQRQSEAKTALENYPGDPNTGVQA